LKFFSYEYLTVMKYLTKIAVFVLLLFFVPALSIQARKKDKPSIVRLETSAGVIRISLSDLTPLHRDNFITLVQQGYYDGILFHRVIKNFMIQGGDPESRGAAAGKHLGDGDPGYTIPAEIVYPQLYHLRGAVAAARLSDDVNPEMRSSGSQFYIVWGQKMTSYSLQKVLPHLAERGVEMDSFQFQEYQVTGGAPHLDGAYTVFGQVVEGLSIVKDIQSQPTDSLDRPLEDVVIVSAKVERLSKAAKKSVKDEVNMK
jgi:cyclophilin family peptidyl-prolyl cis-trans isomerase